MSSLPENISTAKIGQSIVPIVPVDFLNDGLSLRFKELSVRVRD